MVNMRFVSEGVSDSNFLKKIIFSIRFVRKKRMLK